jgi:hypothetical protein
VLIICPPLILIADEIRKQIVGKRGDRDRVAIANK